MSAGRDDQRDAATSPAPDDAAVVRARRRLQDEEGFYIHAAVYALVVVTLYFVNDRVFSPWWFLWPGVGWAVALGIHGLIVFGLHGAVRDWERRRLNELIDEERARH